MRYIWGVPSLLSSVHYAAINTMVGSGARSVDIDAANVIKFLESVLRDCLDIIESNSGEMVGLIPYKFLKEYRKLINTPCKEKYNFYE